MKYVSLGDTGISVSRLGFGIWTLSMKGWNIDNEDKSRSLIKAAFDLGVNFFDTSDRFGNGFGEELISNLSSHLRHEIVISTKGGFDFSPAKFGQKKKPKNVSYDYLISACEGSLRRLKTDYIDIYMIDYPNLSDVENDEPFEALARLKEDGKILAWGASVDYSDDMDEVVEILVKDRGAEVLHIPYNLAETEFIDKFADLLNEYSTGILARRTHCYGLFDGTLDFEQISQLSEHDLERVNPGLERVVTTNNELSEIVYQERNLKSDALEYVLKSDRVSSVLPNITNLEDLVRYCDISD